jgi:hypothetical protein
MKRSISEIQKRGRGRPATGRDPAVTSRLPEDIITAVDKWASKNDAPTRAQAIRRLVELGLKVATPTKAARSTPNKVRAAELAAKTIEKMIDPAAGPEERRERRRRLTKGPPEFRGDRVDLPKAKK